VVKKKMVFLVRSEEDIEEEEVTEAEEEDMVETTIEITKMLTMKDSQ